MKNKTTVRLATPNDIKLILYFINALATYEKMTHRVKVNEASLNESLFVKKHAEVLLLFEADKAVGFAIFYPIFSSFKGKASLYLEDLFIEESYRGNGYGKTLMKELGRITLERDYDNLKWSCLDWNTPSIEFYHSIGAELIDEWVYFKLEGKSLTQFINE